MIKKKKIKIDIDDKNNNIKNNKIKKKVLDI
jgi:hypothetical protein